MTTIVSFTSLQAYLINPQFQLKYQGPLLKILCFTLGFVFAQAILFEATVPLFVPFQLAFEKYDSAYKKALLVGGILGSLTLGLGHTALLLLQLLSYKIIVLKWLRYSSFLSLAVGTIFVQFNILNQQLQQMGEHFEKLQNHHAQSIVDQQQLARKLQAEIGSSCIQVEFNKTRSQHIEGSVNVTDEGVKEQLEQQLSDFFSEPIVISNAESVIAILPTIKYTFRSAIHFEMKYDIYSKTSSDISGDHTVITQIEPGLHAVLVADGMGSGKIAKEQAKQLLFILRQCMQYQISPELTLMSLQYLLNPIAPDSYATLDMLLFDLKKGYLFAWKTGSMATYIVRGNDLFTLESTNAPIGTLQQSTAHQKVQLLANDYVFILTDGMFESDAFDVQEQYLQQQLLQLSQLQWPLSAILYEAVERYKQHFSIEDDVTLIAIKIEHLQYHWTTAKYKNKVGVSK